MMTNGSFVPLMHGEFARNRSGGLVVGCLDGLREFWIKLLHREKKASARKEYARAKEEVIDAAGDLALKVFDEATRPRFVSPPKPKLGEIRAVQKMKHGHQAPWYRKSVKANVKPEED
jgi:hypothetical protein